MSFRRVMAIVYYFRIKVANVSVENINCILQLVNLSVKHFLGYLCLRLGFGRISPWPRFLQCDNDYECSLSEGCGATRH
jgi:hypothetical protein